MKKRDLEGLTIRWAGKEDWNAAVELVWRTFLASEAKEYTEEVIRLFSEFIRSREPYEMFLKGQYPVLLAVCDGAPVGVASLRFETRLSLLFVEKCHWRQGIGSRLLQKLTEYLKNEEQRYIMTVMAAPGAVDFYKKHGFYCLGEEREYGGIRVTDMQKNL